MSIESGHKVTPERSSSPIELPRTLAKEFMDEALETSKHVVEEDKHSKRWRLFEDKVDIPNVGPALLQMDYRQASYPDENPFDQVRFNYAKEAPNENGEHSLIGEMHWYVEKGQSNNPYPFDLMQVHRYIVPEYRDRKGVGRSLYQQSEAWAQQVANEKGEPLTLALSTDQPDTMRWATNLGYTPYAEEQERYEEVIAHPERFTSINETDSKGQIRNTAIERDGKRIRIWFQKVLTPTVTTE